MFRHKTAKFMTLVEYTFKQALFFSIISGGSNIYELKSYKILSNKVSKHLKLLNNCMNDCNL